MTGLRRLGRDDLPALRALHRTPADEAALRLWLSGWDDCASWLWPLLTRANRDADFWYEHANNTPETLAEIRRQRLEVHFEQEWTRFSTADHTNRPAPAGHHLGSDPSWTATT